MTRKKKEVWKTVLSAILDGRDSIMKITKATGLERRTVGHAIRLLRKKNMIKQFPNLQDMRQSRYRPVIKELKRRKLL